MAVTQETIQGSWSQVKGKLRERWGQFSDQELEQARGNVDQLVGLIQQKTGEAREVVESYLEQAASDGASAVRRAADVVRAGATQAGDVARQAVVKVSDTARAGYEQTGNAVRRHPVESLAACFGLGLITGVVVGLLVRSK